MADSRNAIKKELDELIKEGISLVRLEEKGEQTSQKLNKFTYQEWYTKSIFVIKRLMPERLKEFEELYKLEKRKEINVETYTINDYLLGISISMGGVPVFDTTKRFETKFLQQLAILRSANSRIDYILSDIKGVLRDDLFDDEIGAAESLLKAKHLRAAGAVAGVILESHLAEVCNNHEIKFRKKNLAIADYNDALKDNEILDLPNWRQIQRLGDIRNYCSHKKERNPTPDEVEELIEGVKKITKIVF